MNPLTQTINQRKMNERELEAGVAGTKNSWHMEYKDSAWIFLGGLPYEMTEGDVICMFSQYGEVVRVLVKTVLDLMFYFFMKVHINLIRDHGTGKSKGFGFLCYMDQRSTILAVDNLNGVKVLSRMIRVDHVHQYKLPKDLEKLDQDKRKLFEEGCAPKEIDIEFSESSEEELVIKPKKEKKKKKHKRRRHSTSTETDSDSEEDRKIKEKRGRMKERDSGRESNQESRRDGRDKVKQEEKSLEERLRDMANYVKQGEGRAGDGKRMSAKDMFESEKKQTRDRGSSVERNSRVRRSRTRSKDRRARSRSHQRKENRRRSHSDERHRPRRQRSPSRGRENPRRKSSSSSSRERRRR